MPKDFVGVRLDKELVKHLDGIAEANRLSRSEVIRNLLTASSSDPYQVLQDASQGEFSSEFLHHLVSLDRRRNPLGFRSEVHFLFTELREWLLNNPYHPKARERVLAVVALSCRPLSSEIRSGAKRLEEIAQIDSFVKEHEEFMKECAGRLPDNE